VAAVLKKRDMDMTVGSITRNIIVFAFPLLLGNLFQQLYNMVDTWVIGQTGNGGAYAAVGSVGPVINILLGFFMGLSSGAGVIISQYYGAKKYDNVKKAVHTAAGLTLILCVVFTVLGLVMTPILLEAMLKGNVGEGSVYHHAKEYLTIYFAGVSAMMIYNMGAGILRAVGDSRRPFYFLVVAAITNTVLDLVFVFWLDMGVAGVALATVIAQALSAVLTVITLVLTDSCVKLDIKAIGIDKVTLGKVVKLGIPAGFQMSLTAFSNVFVQSYVGGVVGDQTISLAGWTSYSKIDQFIFLPVQSISLAVTTFVGQNYGVGDAKRVKKGSYIGFLMCIASALAIMIPVMIFTPTLAAIFNPDAAVVECATKLLRYITPFYLCCCFNQNFSAALRGLGNTTAPMIIMLTSFVGVRQLYLYLMSSFISNELIPIAMGYPVGWICCAVATVSYFAVYSRKKFKAMEAKVQTV
jgi:putative MATE family efflux protein